MRHGVIALARVAVVVRAGAAPLWWLGVLAAGIGALIPGLTGRWIGIYGGAALFIVLAAAVAFVGRGRYRSFAESAERAGRQVILQDRAVTARVWRRSRMWWLAGTFLAAVGASFAVPAAAGIALAGVGVGLWAKAAWLGRWERTNEALLWVRTDWARRRGGAVSKAVEHYETSGIAAGDASPGGGRRRSKAAAR